MKTTEGQHPKIKNEAYEDCIRTELSLALDLS